jgi:hypothetical protein
MEATLKSLREVGKSELLQILDSLRGKKSVVVEKRFQKVLLEIVLDGDQEIFKDVYSYDIYTKNLSEALQAQGGLPDNICYIVRPDFSMMKIVASHIKECVNAGYKCLHHIYFVPGRTIACEQILEDEGVLNQAILGEYQLGFIPLDTDILSLEMEGLYRQIYVEKDLSPLGVIAGGLFKLQQITVSWICIDIT